MTTRIHELSTALDAVLAEDAQRDARVIAEQREPEGCDIEPVNPADVMVISGWAVANGYTLDAVWAGHGQCYASLSPQGRGAFDPPDSSIFRLDRATTTLERIAWEDGTKRQYPECSICRQRHPADNRHSYE